MVTNNPGRDWHQSIKWLRKAGVSSVCLVWMFMLPATPISSVATHAQLLTYPVNTTQQLPESVYPSLKPNAFWMSFQ